MARHPLAGQSPPDSLIIDVDALIAAYYDRAPDPGYAAQRVSFGTSGHRGSALDTTFNETHIVAIADAVRRYRAAQGIDGPLFLGIDTHALSAPAGRTCLEVLAAAGVDVFRAPEDGLDGGFTPTPAVSHAILTYNRGRSTGLADGIVITPSHNPPRDGGIKYNPPHGGPAGQEATKWIEKEANVLLERGVDDVRRIPLAEALVAPTTHAHDFMSAYIDDLGAVLDLGAVAASGLTLGVDPLGGAGVHYWARIAERYGLNLTVVDTTIDPTFRFMSVDRDGVIRMDPSSPDAMARLIGMRDSFDVAFACDTDYDRHGIVTRTGGLVPSNDYLAAAVAYLFSHRPDWSSELRVGKTVVTSGMIDRVARSLGREVYEVPVGFKWFVDGLFDGSLGFVGEESAGATLLRRDGTPWTTDKDGIAAALLAAEITARTGDDPSQAYEKLAERFGTPEYRRLSAPATAAQKKRLKSLDADDIELDEVGGEPIESVLTHASN
ncbi:MAG: alpha-D-glucose phosphate-specific phosphoglucomutase, partial [Gemmatimonadetes bacterium]|nr:alpha-D-glucose phosphate-specific phosphoglucomutase [Gemmatimonadota bacterium]